MSANVTRALRALALAGACVAAPLCSLPVPTAAQQDAARVVEMDLCVYGGTSGGVAAAVQMRRLGKRAVILEPGRHLGGLTSGGLGATDIGNRGAIGGLSREFYRKVKEHYVRSYGADSEQVRDCNDGFYFEPKVAEKIFNAWVREAGVPVHFGQRIREVRKEGNRIAELITESGLTVRARMWVDASYEGDLMQEARVSYTVGREANAKYSETLNGVHFGHPNHNFKVPVDPFVVEGDPKSGLLKGISAEDPGKQGEGDHRVQAYNFRMCLTNVPENRLPFPKPAGYDPERYTLLARYLSAGVWDALRLSKRMPNGKTDTNNYGGFSTDNIGMNYDYPDGDWATRERIFQEHVTYQQGLMWFLCNDPRVPQAVRDEVSQWGLPKDEFTGSGGWPHQLYIREARRMISDLVMTEHHCRGRITAEDSIGLAAYTMDSHNCQRVARLENGRWTARNEGNVEVGGFPPYPISYRAIVPREAECANLLVPVCLSSSHIAYGSIRMEPVFMILGQSAATAAHFAIEDQRPVQRVDLKKLQARLLEDGQVLSWTAAGPESIVTVAPLVDPKTLRGIVLDDTDGMKRGEWKASTIAGARRVGTGYLHDGNASKGSVTITYTPDLPADGQYQVLLIFPPNPNRATNVPVTITVEGVGRTTVKVNQRSTEGGGFAPLGVYKLPKGKRTAVTVSNEGTDGYVVADGVQFIPVDG